jgi:hypothetical protein
MDCFNCHATEKYNMIHLSPISKHIYKSVYGYFIFRNNIWIFTPLDKEFNANDLTTIADTLRGLNKNDIR